MLIVSLITWNNLNYNSLIIPVRPLLIQWCTNFSNNKLRIWLGSLLYKEEYFGNNKTRLPNRIRKYWYLDFWFQRLNPGKCMDRSNYVQIFYWVRHFFINFKNTVLSFLNIKENQILITIPFFQDHVEIKRSGWASNCAHSEKSVERSKFEGRVFILNISKMLCSSMA